MKRSVSIGVTSIVGWGVSLLAIAPIVTKDIEEGKAAFLLGGPEKWLSILSLTAFSLTQIGRYAQATVLHKHPPLPEATPTSPPK